MEGISKKQHVLNWLFFKNEKRSVFRKAFRVFIFTLPAYMANLGLLYLAPRLVDSETFGIFFLSNTIINWMFAPAIIISMFFLRDITNSEKKRAAGSLQLMANTIIHLVAKWSAMSMLLFGTLSFIFAEVAGVSSLYLIPLIFIITSFAYIGESFRAYFQATDSFLLLGSFNMCWMLSRFLLGSSGLYVFRTAWGGLLGIALALGTIFYVYHRKYIRPTTVGEKVELIHDYHPPNLTGMLPGMLSYSSLILTCNIDIIVGYFVLDSSMLGIYSSSSVLAKAILVLAFPLTHSIYPTLLSNNDRAIKNDWIIFIKGLMLTSLIAGAVIFVLHLSSDLVCSSNYGIKGCNSEIYSILLMPPFFLFLLVYLSLQSFSLGKDWFPSFLFLPTVVFAGISITFIHDINMLSRSFSVFSVIVFVLYFLFILGDRFKLIPASS